MTVEEEVHAAFAAGAPERLADLGGADFLRGREVDLARTSWMPDILGLALAELSAGEPDPAVEDFVVACAAAPVGRKDVPASDYKDAMQALAATALPEELAERCQAVYVRRVADRQDHEVARWVALGAALQIALMHPDLRHALIGVLVRLKVDANPPEFLRRAAKIVGVAHSHWPDSSLAAALDRLTHDTDARDEALFELGMVSLRAGLDADAPGTVDRCFEKARGYFDASLMAREHRPDAFAYSVVLSMLTALRRGDPAEELRQHAAVVQREITVAHVWAPPVKPTWG
ncbi:MAG: hypothetical protein IRZ07_05670 [Microbispora sp.]|nr:hypothetical protein [Microbispora sp.]